MAIGLMEMGLLDEASVGTAILCLMYCCAYYLKGSCLGLRGGYLKFFVVPCHNEMKSLGLFVLGLNKGTNYSKLSIFILACLCPC